MKNWIQGLVLAACSVSVVATAQTSTGQTRGTTPPTGSATSTVSQKQALPQIPNEPEAYLNRLHHTNQLEIQLSELARTKASNPQVKEFANMMVNDHKSASQTLTQVAQKQKIKLGEPKPMNDMERKTMEAHEAVREQLQALEGPMFDQVYMTTMVQSHDATLGKLAAGQQQFGQQPWASFITQQLPKISQHRDQAYRILGQVKPQVVTGTGGAGNMGGSGSHDPNKSH